MTVADPTDTDRERALIALYGDRQPFTPADVADMSPEHARRVERVAATFAAEREAAEARGYQRGQADMAVKIEALAADYDETSGRDIRDRLRALAAEVTAPTDPGPTLHADHAPYRTVADCSDCQWEESIRAE